MEGGGATELRGDNQTLTRCILASLYSHTFLLLLLSSWPKFWLGGSGWWEGTGCPLSHFLSLLPLILFLSLYLRLCLPSHLPHSTLVLSSLPFPFSLYLLLTLSFPPFCLSSTFIRPPLSSHNPTSCLSTFIFPILSFPFPHPFPFSPIHFHPSSPHNLSCLLSSPSTSNASLVLV